MLFWSYIKQLFDQYSYCQGLLDLEKAVYQTICDPIFLLSAGLKKGFVVMYQTIISSVCLHDS